MHPMVVEQAEATKARRRKASMFREVQNDLGLTPLRLELVLWLLALDSGETNMPSRLARALGTTKPNATAAMRKLKAKGLVTVEPVPGDGRTDTVALTPAGEAYANALKLAWEKVQPTQQ